MRKYDLVIFDMDGTILNTLDDIHNAVNAALSKYGYPLKTIDETRKMLVTGFERRLNAHLPRCHRKVSSRKY